MTEELSIDIAGRLGLDQLRELRDQLLTTEEVSAITRLPEGTLRRWRSVALAGGQNPGPPSMRLGPKRIVYSSKALVAWVEQQTSV